MMGMVISLLVVLGSLMLSFFLSIANVQLLVEGDFMNKAMNNAVVHGLQFGQLSSRAKEIRSQPGHNQTTLHAGYVRMVDQHQASNLTYDIQINQENNITLDVEVH